MSHIFTVNLACNCHRNVLSAYNFKNILGESTFKHNGYEVSSDADPFYADTTSDLFTALQKIVDGRLKDDNQNKSS